MTSYLLHAKSGDKLTWFRQGDALKVTVIETNRTGSRAHLWVEGWLTTLWENLDTIRFRQGHNWRVRHGNLEETPQT